MSSPVKKKLQHEVLFSCLDVLSRANATVGGADPKLACDISDAIESLTSALQGAESGGEVKSNAATPVKVDCDVVEGHHDDVIVDVLTNKIVYKYSK